ncbi:discoidin domain-containing protein [candidate division KSB1 bacterium]|nr:discoidin domain-containing protein [candidate division KSB1 bacterium]
MRKETYVFLISLLVLLNGLVVAQDINLALGQKVWVSGGTNPGNLIDGDDNTKWTVKPWPATFIINLGNVNKIELTDFLTVSNRAYYYTIEVSTDSANWTKVVDRLANKETGPRIYDLFAPIDAKFVKVTVSGASNYTGQEVSCGEFRVFGVVATPRAPIVKVNYSETHEIGLSWVGRSNVDEGYTVAWSADGINFTKHGTFGVAVKADTIGDLTPSTEYHFTVSANMSGVEQATSDVLKGMTNKAARMIKASRFSINQIMVTWQDHSDRNNGFKILTSMDKVAWDTLAVTNKADTVMADTTLVGKLLPNTTYHVMVAGYDDQGIWPAPDVVYATTYPIRMPKEGINVLLDENFTDGTLNDPMNWHIPGKEWGEYGFLTPNKRPVPYVFARRLMAGGDYWVHVPMWGDWDDRNMNGAIDAGEFQPYKINLENEVVIFKAHHFSDIAGSSTEYYNINPRVMGPGASGEGVVAIKFNYNNKGKGGYNRQVHPSVNGEQYPIGAPAYQLPGPLSYGNFPFSHDSTLSRTWENLLVFRHVMDTLGDKTNVEAWTHEAPAFEAMYNKSMAVNGEALIDHLEIMMVRPTDANIKVMRDGISNEDAQLGLLHLGVGVTNKADFTLDYYVGIEDFFRMATGWGKPDTVVVGRDKIIYPKTLMHGDANNDGVVDAVDYDVLKANWGKGERKDVVRYHYDKPGDVLPNHGLVAEVNTKTGTITLRGFDGLNVTGYKIMSPAGGLLYAASSPMFSKGLKTFAGTEWSECNNAPYTFKAPTPRDPEKRIKVLGKMYNTDVNPKDLVLFWHDDFGGKTMMGGVVYIDMAFDGIFTTTSGGTAPDTTDAKLFAFYAGVSERRDWKWVKGNGRDLGTSFTIPTATKIGEITVELFKGGWANTPTKLDLAEGDGVCLKLVKCSDKHQSASYVETIATYYGNLPSELDTTEHRFITFHLPTDADKGGITLTPLQGDSAYGFVLGFVSPKEGRELNLSMTHPNQTTYKVPKGYAGGEKLDFGWKQGRDVDGSWKSLPDAHAWAQELTFWVKAAEFGGTAVESEPVVSFPTHFDLSQNYPNPFNPSTTITFSLPNAADVKLTVFDITGRIVNEVVTGKYDAGIHQVQWDGTDINGQLVASGIYYYRFQAENHIFTRKMTLIK